MQSFRKENGNRPEPRPAAVILAAGSGYRMQNGRRTTVKPQVRLRGLSLAERAVAQLRDVGVERFVVVLGSHAGSVRAHFEQVARRRHCVIDYVVARNWDLGNGCSAAEPHVGDEPFLLTMVDHVLSRELILKLLSEPPPPGGISLGVDYDKGRVFDESDLTKVRVDGGCITDIGKHLEVWHGGDTGLFYCTSRLFRGLSRAHVRGRFSLTDGVRECLASGVRAVDVTGCRWADMDTPEAIREAEALVDASLAKGRGDGFVSQYLNRPISRAISKVLARTRMSPDQISVGCFLLAMLGAGALAAPGLWACAVGGLLIQLASVLDGCDGEIARIKFLGSARGAWLDTILDRYADLTIGIAITFTASRHCASPWIWPAGVAATTSFLIASYVNKEYELRFGHAYPNNLPNRLKRRDLRVLVVAVGAVAGHPFPALVTIGAFTHAAVLWIMADAWRRAGRPIVPRSPHDAVTPGPGEARWAARKLATASGPPK